MLNRVYKMSTPSSSDADSTADLILFKSLNYTTNTFINRWRMKCCLHTSEEYHLLQGAYRIIKKNQVRITENLDSSSADSHRLEAIGKEYSEELDSLFELKSFCEYPCEDDSDSSAESIDHEYLINPEQTNAGKSSNDRKNGDEEEKLLEEIVEALGRKFSFDHESVISRFGQRFWECLLYCDSKDSNETMAAINGLYMHIDVKRMLRTCRGLPTIENVCRNINRNRSACRYKLSHLNSVTEYPLYYANYEDQKEECEPTPFQKAVMMMWAKESSQSSLFMTRIWELEGRSMEYIAEELLSHLQDLMDDIIRCSYDYSKWRQCLISTTSQKYLDVQGSSAYEALCNHLGYLMNYASTNGMTKVFHLCIDLLFCISLRHPNPCEILECCLRYMKSVLIPSLENPYPDRELGSESDTKTWMPRLAGHFESLLDYEYLSIHQPLFQSFSMGDNEYDTHYRSSIPMHGTYVLPLDIVVNENLSAQFVNMGMSTSPILRLSLFPCNGNFTAEESIIFVSDGHKMIVYDDRLSVLDMNSMKSYSLEFIFDNGDMVLLVNGEHFYEQQMRKYWKMQGREVKELFLSIACNQDYLHVGMSHYMTPALRSEVIRRNAVSSCSIPLSNETSGGLLNSLYERHLYLRNVTSCIHFMIARLLYNLEKNSSSPLYWNRDLTRFVGLLFEMIVCNLDFVGSICTYFDSYDPVNGLTLWRMICDNILSLLSALNMLMNSPADPMHVPEEMRELFANCFVGCLRFRSIGTTPDGTDKYHLQEDLDENARSINLSCLSLIAICPGIMTQLFAGLNLDLLVELMVAIVSVEPSPHNASLILSASIDALKSLGEGYCVDIFTKRALSKNMSSYKTRHGVCDFEIQNHWWKMVINFLESEKESITCNEVSLEPTDISCCTCELPAYGKGVCSPFFAFCCACASQYSKHSKGRSVDGNVMDASYYQYPKPSMLLCRLLLKHGALFMCLNITASYNKRGHQEFNMLNRINHRANPSLDRFGDWKSNVIYTSGEGSLLNVRNSRIYFRMFNRDDIVTMEKMLLQLLRYNCTFIELVSNQIFEVSSDNDMSSRIYHFLNTLSIVDIMAYMLELFENMTSMEGTTAVIHQSFTTCVNVMQPMIHLVATSYNCINKYFLNMEETSMLMNLVCLQFHSHVHCLCKMILYLYKNCKAFNKRHLLSKLPEDSLPVVFKKHKAAWGGSSSVPECLMRGAWIKQEEYELYRSLFRLSSFLQDSKYDKGCAVFTKDIDEDIPEPCEGTNLARGILIGDSPAMELLRPTFKSAHPSMGICHLGIAAVFIHLLDCSLENIDVANRYASQIVLQLLRQLQNSQNFSSIEEKKRSIPIYVKDIFSRCDWVVENTKGGIFSTKVDGQSLSDGFKTLSAKGAEKKSSSMNRSRSSTNMFSFSDGKTAESTLRSHRRKRASNRSRSSGKFEETAVNSTASAENEKIDIKPHLVDIANFLLHGPSVDGCDSDLDSERTSTLCRYTMWRCINMLTSMFADARFVGGESQENPYVMRPLMLGLLHNREQGSYVVSSEGMHGTLKILWYNILKTSRSMVIQSVGNVQSTKGDQCRRPYDDVFGRIVLNARSRVLERICDWYLRSGIHSQEYTDNFGCHLPFWTRISLTFFGLLFSLDIEPMNSSRYVSSVFRYILDVLQPVKLKRIGHAESDRRESQITGSIILLFVSYGTLCLGNIHVKEFFSNLLADGYVKKGFKRCSNGLIYLWEKKKSSMDSCSSSDHPLFRYIWSLDYLGRISVEKELRNLRGIIRSVESTGSPSSLTVPCNRRYNHDMIAWHMGQVKGYEILDVSLNKNQNWMLNAGVDVFDKRIFVYAKYENISSKVSDDGAQYMDLIHNLGGKLELEDGNGIWTPVEDPNKARSIHPMREDLYCLLRFMLWTYFSSRAYSPKVNMGGIEIASALCRMILEYLCKVARILKALKKTCDCTAKPDDSQDTVTFKYVPMVLDGEVAHIPLEGISHKTCKDCMGRMLYRCEIENFWRSVLTLLVKEIDSTEHYGIVQHALTSLLTTFNLGDDELDTLLSNDNIGQAFCELFVVAMRRLTQEHLSDKDSVVSTAEPELRTVISPGLHGMFLYRWLPPLQRSPLEFMFSVTRKLFHNVLNRAKYTNTKPMQEDSRNDPFANLPRSENFITHRASADFQANIDGNTLQVTRALNMGGISLFRIPLGIDSTSYTRGTASFFILSPGRFGITVAPADCIFGSVVDLFERNDVVGFMTNTCPSFVHDSFAATINYRVGDVLSASFTVEEQDDGQICLRTELLIAGNSIGSVLEVVYEPSSQNDPMRRMSMVFIFQDPQTVVYNGLNEATSPMSGRLVRRETQSSFRSDTASEQIVTFNRYSTGTNNTGDTTGRESSVVTSSTPMSDNVELRDADETATEEQTSVTSENYTGNSGTEQEDGEEGSDETQTDYLPSLERFLTTDWDTNYDVVEQTDDETDCAEVLSLCKEELWQDMITRRGSPTTANSTIMFIESIQLYQAILMTNVTSLGGLKEEVVSQVCLSFESLYNKLASLSECSNVEDEALRDCFSWLCVLACDIEANCWKNFSENREAKLENISELNLPWLIGSSSTSRSCASKLSVECCCRLLCSLSQILSLPSLSSLLRHTLNGKSCSRFVALPDQTSASLMLALASKCLLTAVIVGNVLCEKQVVFDASDCKSAEYICVERLVGLIYTFIGAGGPQEETLYTKSLLNVLDALGIVTYEQRETESASALAEGSGSERSAMNESMSTEDEEISRGYLWRLILRSVQSSSLKEKSVRMLDGTDFESLSTNPKMFATCDYSYHCASRLPSERRNIIRRALSQDTCESDMYDLLAMLLLLSPNYFLESLLNGNRYKCLHMFRNSIVHFVRDYDFNCADYWSWGYVGRSVKVEHMDHYSRTVDPLYGWQRLLYMERDGKRLDSLLDVFFTELLYCITLMVHDYRVHFGGSHVIHWILDGFLRHPLCNGTIRKRFVNTYVWSVLHTMLINCSALPCKLAVISSRITSWLTSVSSKSQSYKMFFVIHHLGKSALHRVNSVCNFYNTLDLDSFTNIDLKRQDHAVKLASAMLVHIFASTLSLLMGHNSETLNMEDDIVNLAKYMFIASNPNAYSDKFIRQSLKTHSDLSLEASVPVLCLKEGIEPIVSTTRTFVTTSEISNLDFTFQVNKSSRLVLCSDIDCKEVIGETVIFPDIAINVKNWEKQFIDIDLPAPFDLIRRRCYVPDIVVSREVTPHFWNSTFRVGFLASGIANLSSSSSRVHFEDDCIFLEVQSEHEICQRITENQITWIYGKVTVHLSLPQSVKLLKHFVAVFNPSYTEYTEKVSIRCQKLHLPLNNACFYISEEQKPALIPCPEGLRLREAFRSGMALSDDTDVEKTDGAMLLHMSSAERITDSDEEIDLTQMTTRAALPFRVSVIVRSCPEGFYVGIDWFDLRFMWYSSGMVICPKDAPVFRHGVVTKSQVSLPGIGYTTGDTVGFRFFPQEHKLLFIKNGGVCMILDFLNFYRPIAVPKCSSKLDFADKDLEDLKECLFQAILVNDLETVQEMVSFAMSKDSPEDTCVKLLEEPFNEEKLRDPNKSKYDYYNSLYFCCLLGRLSILKCLAAADVNFDRGVGLLKETPLMAAVKSGHMPIVSYLLCILGVNVNAKDERGNTPMLHFLNSLFDGTLLENEKDQVQMLQHLLAFGADVLTRNTLGCTTIDILTRNLKKRAMWVPLLNSYMMNKAHKLGYEIMHNRWPGLLGDSVFVCGIRGNENTYRPDVVLHEVHIDNKNLMVDHIDAGSTLEHYETFEMPKHTILEYLASSLERIRQAMDVLISKIALDDTSVMPYMNGSSRFRKRCSSISEELCHYLRNLVKDVRKSKKWDSWEFLSDFARHSKDYCNRLEEIKDNSEVLLSFLQFEQCIMRLRFLPPKGSFPNVLLQTLGEILENPDILAFDRSPFCSDYLVMSYLSPLAKCISSLCRNSVINLTTSDYSIPRFSKERVKIGVSTRTQAFHRLRYNINRQVTKDMDFAIHCIADLCGSERCIRELLTKMICRCTTREEIQSYLPPVGSPLWNGIYTTLDSLLECFSKLKFILRSNLEVEPLDEVEELLLMQHMMTIISDGSGKEHIPLAADQGNAQRLQMLIERLNLVEQLGPLQETEMRITHISMLNTYAPPNFKNRGPGLLTHWSEYILAAFCYILVNDRISIIDKVNGAFKVLVPIVGTVLNQPLVEYFPIGYQVLQPYQSFISAPHCLDFETILMNKADRPNGTGPYKHEEMGICIGPSELPLHWSVYFGNRSLIRRSLINELYRKTFICLQTMNRERPYFSVRIDRGISATAQTLKHSLWYQSCQQFLACNPNILRARANHRPFIVVFKGEGATDFGGPFQEFLSCLSSEVMQTLNLESRLTQSGEVGCMKCSNTLNSYGPYQDTVTLKSWPGGLHPMIKMLMSGMPEQSKVMLRCGDLSVSCSSGCCGIFSPTETETSLDDVNLRNKCKCGGSDSNVDHCSQGIPLELNLYESLGRLFAMCLCMMNPMNVVMNPIVWKKMVTANISLKDLADFDKMSSDLLHKLHYSSERENMLNGLTFSCESVDGRVIELLSDGSNINVTNDNVDLFARLATIFRLSQCDIPATWLVRGFNAVIPIGRFRILLDYKLLEFMICGDPVIDLEILRAHTVSTSVNLKRDLFDVLAKFDNLQLQMFLRFVSGRSRLPPPQSEWSLQVEYEAPKDNEEDSDSRLPTSSTCGFRLLMPRYSSQQTMHDRLFYAIQHCMAIDLDAYHIHDELGINQ